MVRGKARADEGDFPGSRIIHREMAVGAFDGEHLGRGMARALLAKVRILRSSNARGEPNASVLVQHGIVHAGLAVPDWLFSPIGGGRQRIVLRRRRLWISH